MRAIFPKTVATLRERLADARSRKVVLLSHCLLNENARYMGGAFCAGANPEILSFISKLDAGVIQMPCPERLSWGGIYKRHIYQFHGIGRLPGAHRLCTLFMPLFLFLMNWRMRRVARNTASEIQDYIENGMEVLGIVGIRGSPTCGVTCHPDLAEYFQWSSKIEIRRVERSEQNDVLKRVAKSGPGVYICLLARQLKRRRISIPFYEYDLYDEMEHRPNRALKQAEERLSQVRVQFRSGA
jgi:predicted secreted protein